MFKKIVFLTIALVCLCAAYAYSAPCYGTHMPEKRHWTWGAQGDFLVDRNLKDNQGATSGNRYFVTGSYGVFNWLCFDGKIGMGDVSWKNSNPGNLDFNAGFAGGYGFRVKGYENKGLGIRTVAGFQHISVHPPTASPQGDHHRVIIDDWQGSAIISKDVWNFSPYIGARYGTVDYIKWVNEHDRHRVKSEKKWGTVLGVDYMFRDDIRLNIESDFIDGEEFSVGISRDF